MDCPAYPQPVGDPERMTGFTPTRPGNKETREMTTIRFRSALLSKSHVFLGAAPASFLSRCPTMDGCERASPSGRVNKTQPFLLQHAQALVVFLLSGNLGRLNLCILAENFPTRNVSGGVMIGPGFDDSSSTPKPSASSALTVRAAMLCQTSGLPALFSFFLPSRLDIFIHSFIPPSFFLLTFATQGRVCV